jgi:xylan 1,4-beta-xylosidase
MAASGGLFNGHHMLVARSKNVLGPYENSPYNPLLTQKNNSGINFHQGHGKLFQTQLDEWFTMVLSQRWLPSESTEKRYQKGVSQLGRETSLIRLNWTQDGWPVDETSRQPLDIAIKPKLKEAKVVNIYSDEFNKPMLNIPWQFRRNPLDANLSLTEKKGNLRLYSGDFDIDTLLGRNLILQRERWLKYTASTKISFVPKTTEQAGLTCYYDTKTYARLGWQKSKLGDWELSLEEMKYGIPIVRKLTSIRKVSHLFLRLRVDKLTRVFEYSYDNKHWLSAGEILDTSYLSDQGTPNWGFMGMMVGVYSFNRGSGNKIPADFDWFKISDYK